MEKAYNGKRPIIVRENPLKRPIIVRENPLKGPIIVRVNPLKRLIIVKVQNSYKKHYGKSRYCNGKRLRHAGNGKGRRHFRRAGRRI